MPNKQGDFIWYELLTDDADGARTFYSAVVGWDIEVQPSGDMNYQMISASDGPVAGMAPLTSEMKANGARPCWLGYIGVDDVDASVAAIKAAGGSAHMEPWDVADVGRMAFVADPQGVMFYVMRGASDQTGNSFAYDMPLIGHCAWNELSTTDTSSAVDFYARQFGWVQDGEMDMGPMGKYLFLRHGEGMIGAIMPKMPEMPVPFWTYYFRVPDIEAAVATIKEHKGTVLQEPIEIPGGDFSMNALDPRGAAFALVGARK